MSSVEVEFEKKIGLEKDRVREIILFNDDVNTFDYVIKTLMSICNHSLKQAEQCTFIVHYSGKCAVKSGSLNELKPICSKLLDAGLTAEIV
ncbi:MAG: ATP-dependent Clp protease adaptor ClpS [Flavobacteriaceae bacterium]|nr:ATP-dependent Clp protease adaptor ClpS [Flavobacteriaceae bacterium]|tara:strand:+ start:1457 stop:1729 length:273 start_codon:yes stop_codon:yes gene_type:complete